MIRIQSSSSPLKIGVAGGLVMAAAMGFGRFFYTPVLPGMMGGIPLSAADAGLIAAGNFAGYLSGALLASQGWATGYERKLALGGLGSKLNQVSGVARADYVCEQEKRLPWSTTPQSLFDAFAEKIRRVPQGYGENRSFLRREALMDIRSTFGFVSITERFSLMPRSKS